MRISRRAIEVAKRAIEALADELARVAPGSIVLVDAEMMEFVSVAGVDGDRFDVASDIGNAIVALAALDDELWRFAREALEARGLRMSSVADHRAVKEIAL